MLRVLLLENLLMKNKKDIEARRFLGICQGQRRSSGREISNLRHHMSNAAIKRAVNCQKRRAWGEIWQPSKGDGIRIRLMTRLIACLITETIVASRNFLMLSIAQN
jgi:hypothetical protein